MFEAAMRAGEGILVHNYVVVESAALLQNRLGQDTSLRFLRESRAFTIQWVEPDLHDQATDYLAHSGLSKLSFVDAMSFVVMRLHSITCFIGFDRHFIEAGFTQYLSVPNP